MVSFHSKPYNNGVLEFEINIVIKTKWLTSAGRVMETETNATYSVTATTIYII